MSALRARIDLPLGVHAPTGARTIVRQLLVTWGFTEKMWLDSAALVVAELVTNSVRYGGGSLEIAIEAHEDEVIISVRDESSTPPKRREPGDSGGFGLLIIEELCSSWGVEDFHGGKRVWVRLPTHPMRPE